MAKEAKKMIANNKKAYFDYFIEDKYEAGIALAGTEVKSLRMGKCSIKEAFIRIENGEVYVYNMHIIGLAKGKKLYDKRQDIAKKDQRREAEKQFKVKNLY